MENKILDELLKYLLNTDFNEFAHIRNDANKKSGFLKNIDNATLKSALLKLVKDGYVNQNSENTIDPLFNTPTTNYFYDISFEGRIFIKNGGYISENSLNEKDNNRLLALENHQRQLAVSNYRLTLIIAIGTFVAAIYYLIQMLEFFGILTIPQKS